MILSIGMMLKYSFQLQKESDAVESAVEKVLRKGFAHRRPGEKGRKGHHLSPNGRRRLRRDRIRHGSGPVTDEGRSLDRVVPLGERRLGCRDEPDCDADPNPYAHPHGYPYPQRVPHLHAHPHHHGHPARHLDAHADLHLNLYPHDHAQPHDYPVPD